MKKLLNFLSLIAISSSLYAQTTVESGGVVIQLTPSQMQQIASANQLGTLAADNYNKRLEREAVSDEKSTTRNPVVLATPTPDRVNVFSVDGENMAYDPARNAFIPVKTRQQAIRIATKSFDPINDAAGKMLRSRQANTSGENAEVIQGVSENRTKVITTEADEEVIAN